MANTIWSVIFPLEPYIVLIESTLRTLKTVSCSAKAGYDKHDRLKIRAQNKSKTQCQYRMH